jgi:multidrug resistance efflux pump
VLVRRAHVISSVTKAGVLRFSWWAAQQSFPAPREDLLPGEVKAVRRRSIAALLVVLAAVSAGAGWHWRRSRAPAELRLPGMVEIQEVKLASKAGGRVHRVLVREGDLVQAGDVLVRLEVPELEAQRLQAQARLEQAEADREKAENGPRTEERDAARAAVASARARWQRLKAGPRAEEIQQARAELDAARAELGLARQDHTRAVNMYRAHALARSDYDQAVSTRLGAQGRTEAAQAHLDVLLAGSRPEEIDEAAAELRRCQANYDLLLAGTRSEELAAARARASEARARLQELDAQLREALVRAPGPAVVEVLAVRPGDVVAPNQALLHVLAAEDLWVRAYIPETDLGKIRLNQEVEVRLDSYPGRTFAGTIRQIAGESEFTPRNVQSVSERRYQLFGCKIQVSDPQGVFKSGMAAEVVLPLHD